MIEGCFSVSRKIHLKFISLPQTRLKKKASLVFYL
jgi:hypothetical protein